MPSLAAVFSPDGGFDKFMFDRVAHRCPGGHRINVSFCNGPPDRCCYPLLRDSTLLHSIVLHIAQCTLHTKHCRLGTAYYTLHIAHITLHTVHFTLHITHCIAHCVALHSFRLHCNSHFEVLYCITLRYILLNKFPYKAKQARSSAEQCV